MKQRLRFIVLLAGMAVLGYFLRGMRAESPLPLQALAVGTRAAHYAGGRSNAHQSGTLRYRYGVAYLCRALRLTFGNYYRDKDTGAAELPNSNSITFKAALEIGMTTYPLSFQGKRTVTLEGGAALISDPLEITVPAGTSVFARVYYDAGPNGYVPVYAHLGSAGAPAGQDGAAYDADLCDNTGLAGMQKGVNGFTAWGPTALIGTPSDGARKACAALVGDSIMNGTADNPPNDYANGFVRRALGTAIPYVDLSSGGESAEDFLFAGYRRAQLLRYATHAICDYGTNDIGSGASLPTLKSHLRAVWALLKGHGLQVYQCTILPRTTSTDQWETEQHQTVRDYETVRVALNDWLRDTSANGAVAQSAGALAGVFETADKVESARNSGKWKAATKFDAGAATAGGSNYLLDPTKHWPAHTLDYRYILHIIGGTGAGQYRVISANSSDGDNPGDKIYTAEPWTTTPDGTSTYEIIETYTIDGIHPTAGGHAALATAVDTGRFRE